VIRFRKAGGEPDRFTERPRFSIYYERERNTESKHAWVPLSGIAPKSVKTAGSIEIRVPEATGSHLFTHQALSQ
jgi:hypothetical protein